MPNEPQPLSEQEFAEQLAIAEVEDRSLAIDMLKERLDAERAARKRADEVAEGRSEAIAAGIRQAAEVEMAHCQELAALTAERDRLRDALRKEATKSIPGGISRCAWPSWNPEYERHAPGCLCALPEVKP